MNNNKIPTDKNKPIYAQKFIQTLLEGTGITINGHQPQDIQVHDPAFYSLVLKQGSLGLGESYMDNLWDCDRIDEAIYAILNNKLDEKVTGKFHFFYHIPFLLFNLQNRARAYIVGQKHYDLGNDLFAQILDPGMNYSCGYWKDSTTLEQAQTAKLDLIAKKLELKPGMKVLDIGCGWGGFAEHIARHYGCEVTEITISHEQADYARERCKTLPVTILLEDYRDLNERFDRISSIGMFEHVGHKNYATYFNKVKSLLKDESLFVLHTIGTNTTHIGNDAWLNKYIFPNGVLPSITQLIKPTEKLFVMEDWQNFGPDYDKTLMAWYENFIQHWPKLQDKYSETTYRMFCYYLLSCAGLFRSRHIQLWQIIFSNNRKQRYDAVR